MSVEAARAVRAYGLAAAHLGEAMPVVVISADGVADKYFMLFNPRVVEVSAETEKGTEGSVSLPGALVEVDRPKWAQIEFINTDGTTQSTRFEGFAARIALHEIEQTQGIFFLDRVSRLKRDRALKKAAKATR